MRFRKDLEPVREKKYPRSRSFLIRRVRRERGKGGRRLIKNLMGNLLKRGRGGTPRSRSPAKFHERRGKKEKPHQKKKKKTKERRKKSFRKEL